MQRSVPPQGEASAVFTQRQVVRGPLPMAQEFEKYERVLPGSADRILKMAETEASERHANTRKIVRAQVYQAYISPVLAFVLAAGSIVAGTFLTLFGHEVLGGGAYLIGAGSLVGSFVALFRNHK